MTDLIVIGAGSAGFSAAITAAELGAEVTLVGQGTIGGTCVNVGCVPSKALIRAMEALHHANEASRFLGIEATARLQNWQTLVAQKDTLVEQLRQAKYADLLPAYDKLIYREGRATFDREGVLVNGQRAPADKVIIATGAAAAIPAIPRIDGVSYLTSTTALELQTLPESLFVIGGGYIGCELAQMFARAGVGVTLFTRRRLVPDTEPEIGDAITGYLREEGIVVHAGLSYQSIAQDNGGVVLTTVSDGETTTHHAQQVLVATGRRPNSEGLGLEVSGIDTEADGRIVVDSCMRTSRRNVYAAGDVTGQDQFVYMAAHGAKIAAENALNGDGRRYDDSAVPAVVFTDPQIASVGLTEAEARQRGHAVKSSVLPLSYLPRALAARDTRGLIKLVADRTTDRLLGAHILAPEGCDSIQTAALAIRQGMTVQNLADMIFPYLTTVEGLKLAAQTFDKDVAKLSCCAG
ncbi:mercury(II) reductase [Limibacillus halophilus]|uniref:Mercuric reductase n=1 Tax=Limibacillus halophilus TaxID=1579333 RepID=A0A839SPT6_9PROT|nr:mercury(II) reductase [Limibacillus halophilus]MBB3064228.1 mercury(II) reductase [Limibacillus halophilus]